MGKVRQGATENFYALNGGRYDKPPKVQQSNDTTEKQLHKLAFPKSKEI